MNDPPQSESPSYVELESVKTLPEVTKITTLSVDTIERRYPQYVVHLSPRRKGMKLKHALEIARGR
jgi:hypothetical protein